VSAAAATPTLRLLRVGALAWLFGWYALLHLLAPLYLVFAQRMPLDYPDFPGLFTSPRIAAFCYLAPLGTLGALLRPAAAGMRLVALLFVGCAVVMLLHVDAYNDATFLVGFWLGLWLLWLSGRAARGEADTVEDAAGLLVCIGSFLFLGGVVGKLHAAWWDGQVIAHVLVDERTYWFFPWMRDRLSPPEQRQLSRWLARIGLSFELAAVASVLLPLRAGLLLLIAASLGVIACAGWTLASVLGGFVIVATYCRRQLGRPAPDRQPAG
jgi:hypothetical protein